MSTALEATKDSAEPRLEREEGDATSRCGKSTTPPGAVRMATRLSRSAARCAE